MQMCMHFAFFSLNLPKMQISDIENVISMTYNTCCMPLGKSMHLPLLHTLLATFCTWVKRNIWCDGLHSDKPCLLISIQRRFLGVLKRDRLAISNHLLYDIAWMFKKFFLWRQLSLARPLVEFVSGLRRISELLCSLWASNAHCSVQWCHS